VNLYKSILTVFFMLLWSLGYAQSGTNAADTASLIHYKPGVLSVVQFQFTENGIGFGMSYERAIDKRGVFAFYIPVMVTFDVANTSRIYDYNTGNYNTGKADAMFYTMPGIKFYPTGSYGKIKYATGALIVVGTGQKSSYLTDLNGLNETEQVQHHFLTGLIWQNSLNVNLDAHLYIGTELGVGGTLINRVGYNKVNNETLVEGSFKIGFRL